MKTLALLLCLLSSCAFGQTKPKTKIKFVCNCDDKVGTLFATAFRDALAKSPRYEETSISQSGSGKDVTYNWVVEGISIDLADPPQGNASAFSIVLKLGNILYFDQWVQTCGTQMIDSCVNTLFASIDRDLTKYQQ